ncbi:hypothetical protein PMIN06_002811 [Paraphaeosphaeria minitans]
MKGKDLVTGRSDRASSPALAIYIHCSPAVRVHHIYTSLCFDFTTDRVQLRLHRQRHSVLPLRRPAEVKRCSVKQGDPPAAALQRLPSPFSALWMYLPTDRLY